MHRDDPVNPCDTIFLRPIEWCRLSETDMTFKATLISFMLLLVPVLGLSQEGHPLKGTWRGSIGTGSSERPLLIIMDYENDSITGMINPGRNSYRFSSAELDAPNWELSATATTREGANILLQATLNDIGSRSRYLEGSWQEEGNSYPFRITRE